jgi:hypothetical protein
MFFIKNENEENFTGMQQVVAMLSTPELFVGSS